MIETTVKEELTPKQAADFLDIGTETLKKYALLLEQNGHNVYRNARNHRIYNGTDMALIKAMLMLNREKSVPLEQAASIVMSSDTDIQKIIGNNGHNGTDNGNHNTVPTVTTLQENDWIEFYNGFVTQMKDLKNENKALQILITENDAKHEKAFQEVSNLINDQAKIIAEQNKAIEKQTATIEALHKKIEDAANSKPSLWKKLFGK